jgi:hypothetical protein
MSKQIQKVHTDLLTRYRRIADLWIAYQVKNEDGPAVYGREFYQAVGELLQGLPTKKLELYHIDVTDVESVVFPGAQGSL